MAQNERINIGWIDMLRVAACFSVVFSHCCDPFVAHFDANREMFVTGVFAGSIMRPCVPLFAMMTRIKPIHFPPINILWGSIGIIRLFLCIIVSIAILILIRTIKLLKSHNYLSLSVLQNIFISTLPNTPADIEPAKTAIFPRERK